MLARWSRSNRQRDSDHYERVGRVQIGPLTMELSSTFSEKGGSDFPLYFFAFSEVSSVVSLLFGVAFHVRWSGDYSLLIQVKLEVGFKPLAASDRTLHRSSRILETL